MAETTPFATLQAQMTGIGLLLIGVLGVVALAVGVVGFLSEEFLLFDQTHNVIHLLLGGIAAYVGFSEQLGLGAPYLDPIAYGKIFGFVYMGLGVLGFATGGELLGIADAIGLHLELGENLIHVAVGAMALVAGFYVADPDADAPDLFARTAEGQ